MIGIAPHVLDRVLNHTGGSISGVAAIYNRHQYLDERRDALDVWAQHVERVRRRPGQVARCCEDLTGCGYNFWSGIASPSISGPNYQDRCPDNAQANRRTVGAG